jgi:predicted O-linked N-acetylglucosamine transferase (SPINDLY family)
VAAIGCCDAVLDSIGWSGFNSTIEGLVHDLPVVTMKGPLMRGAHTAAVLRMMQVEDTIAQSLDDYVAIAVRLGRDTAWRADMKAKMAANKHRLYRDRSCITALEEFLLRVARPS